MMPPWAKAGRVPSLDGLRGIAIAMVTVAHLGQHFAPGGTPDTFTRPLGPAGVDLFFVVSGFLISLLMLREEAKTGGVSLRGFYFRRALRIFPAYFAFLLVLPAFYPVPGEALVRAATYTTNLVPGDMGGIGHTWSLSVEEHFYLCWPVAVAVIGSRRAWWCLPAGLVVAPLLRVLIRHGGPIDIDQFTPTRADTLAVGCLLAYAVRSEAGERAARVLSRGWACWGLVALALTILFLSTYVVSRPGYVLTAKRPVEAVAWAAVVLALACRPPKVLALRPVVAVGVLSYSLYLWQPLTAPPAYWGWGWGESLAALCLAAVLSHLLVERPFLRVKDRGRG